jgi:hypothetical protein
MEDMSKIVVRSEEIWSDSDTSPLTEQDSGYCTDRNPSSTIDDGSDSDPVLFSDDDLDYSFVQAKQKILKRAADVFLREDQLNALANHNEHSKIGRAPLTTVLDEAKGFLHTLSLAAGPTANQKPRKKSRTQKNARANVPRIAANPRDLQINVNLVDKRTSIKFDEESHSLKKINGSSIISMIPSSLLTQCQWMTRVLMWNKASTLTEPRSMPDTAGSWKIMSDPWHFACGVIPPRAMDTERGVDLNYALSITDEARLVTLSTPPFYIVHVNKAFQRFAELPSDCCLLGRPVENVIQVSPTATPEQDAKHCYWPSLILNSNKSCCIDVLPVVQGDAQRNKESSLSSLSTKSTSNTFMSHILICVSSPANKSSLPHIPSYITFPESAADVTSDASDVSKDDSSSSSSTLQSSLWGTVG